MNRALGIVCLVLTSCAGPPPVTLHAGDAYPEELAAWGLLIVDGERLRLGERVLPYDLATPLFTDYVHKLRTVWMPPGTAARYARDETFTFPAGTILSKTFYYPRDGETLLRTERTAADFDGAALIRDRVRLIETRLLVKQPAGWDAMTYVWNDAQTEARLTIAGKLERLTLYDESGVTAVNYVVPTRNDCAGCHATDHTSGAIEPLGPKARNLNKRYAHYRTGGADQLERWHAAGYLDGLPPAEHRPTGVLWGDERYGVAARARAYLDVNCGHCHNPSGAADTSGLFLDAATTDARHLGVCKPPIAAGRGTGGRRFDIVPGDPDASIMTFRMASRDPGVMMPEIGRSVVHAEGLSLVREWIAAMAGGC